MAYESHQVASIEKITFEFEEYPQEYVIDFRGEDNNRRALSSLCVIRCHYRHGVQLCRKISGG
jgi:hypothetical protein